MEEIKLKGNDKTAKDESTYIVLQIVIEMLARGIEFLPVDIYKSMQEFTKLKTEKSGFLSVLLTESAKMPLLPLQMHAMTVAGNSCLTMI